MTFSGLVRSIVMAGAFVVSSPLAAHADPSEPKTGAAFGCDNGSRLVLSFMDSKEGMSALVWLEGNSYKLAHQPQKPGPLQIVWSDGEHSLT